MVNTVKKAVNSITSKPDTSKKVNTVTSTSVKKTSSSSSKNVCPNPSRSGSKSLPVHGGPPNGVLTSPDGKQKRFYDDNGDASKDLDYGHPEHHPDLPSPHGHEWDWNKTPPRQKAIDPKDFSKIVVDSAVTAGTVYLIYRGVRMLPSLFPGLWWTIPINAATP